MRSAPRLKIISMSLQQTSLFCGVIDDCSRSFKAIDERVFINFRDKNAVFINLRAKNTVFTNFRAKNALFTNFCRKSVLSIENLFYR